MKSAPKLNDTLECVIAMREKPKVVMLHVGTNNLNDAEEESMIDLIKKIYEILEARGIKFVYNFILPSATREATAKAEVINSRVFQSFAMNEDVYIGRNDKFYWHGVKSTRLFDADGTHVNEDGTRHWWHKLRKCCVGRLVSCLNVLLVVILIIEEATGTHDEFLVLSRSF